VKSAQEKPSSKGSSRESPDEESLEDPFELSLGEGADSSGIIPNFASSLALSLGKGEDGDLALIRESHYYIEDLCCQKEEKLIREKLQGFSGISGLKFDLNHQIVTISHNLPDLKAVEELLTSLYLPPVPVEDPKASSELKDSAPLSEDSCCCQAKIFSGTPQNLQAYQTTRYLIEDMDCPVEERLIRDKLHNFPGVVSLEFNLLKRILTIRHNLKELGGVEAALVEITMTPRLLPEAEGTRETPGEKKSTAHWIKLIVAALLALSSEVCHFVGAPTWILFILAMLAIVVAGFKTYKKGWVSIRHLNLNMNALMTVAVTGAILIGEFPEAAMVMVLFTLAEELEERSLARARKAISGLISLAPETATVLGKDGGFSEVEANQVEPGARVRVRPGEKLSLDGRIVSGSSTLNEAPITGESKSVTKEPGDLVFAGTINESGSFEYTVTEPFSNSTLARILKAVEEAQASRAPTQRFVDKFAAIYSPVVFGIGVLIAIIPPLFTGGDFLAWIYRALVTMVIACPCALVISTPVTIVSGLAAATRKGLLIKGGSFLELGRKLTHIAMDKTGTLTLGKPVLTDTIALQAENLEDLRRLAGSLANRSDHPVSRAIQVGLNLDKTTLLEVEDFKALPGEGIQGVIEGKLYYLGNRRLAQKLQIDTPILQERFESLEAESKTTVALIAGDTVLGVIAVNDSLRPESREALSELESLGIQTIMLTGDNQMTASAIAKEAGVKDYRSGLLPADKLEIIEELSQFGAVGMVGDGINDAPALAKADIGFAMGAAGTDTAIETASVAIMDDDLRKVPAFVKLSQETHWHLWENITFSLVVKLIFLILTFFGFTKMWMAIFADLGVCLIVVANSLRLLKK
jgi:Cd2+/Zn2+-exporting ATPase